ncbi:MAG: polysaccharide biosynthesis C-terminal domain-containing protein [Erysipelotrichaceae bacterium]
MDKKLLSNYLYNILYQLVKVALPVIIVPYTMGHLGAETLGISDFAGNIANWFILFGVLGINIYGNREIARVRDNKEDLSRTFFEILTMRIFTVSIACILYIAYVSVFVTTNQIIYYLYIITIVATAFEIIWFYYGVEDFKSAAIRNLIVKMIGVTFIIIFVKEPSDLWKMVLINGLSEVFGLLIMFVQLPRYIHFVRVNFITSFKKHVGASFTLFVPTIAISVYTLLDQTMLGFLTNDTANVALYKASQAFVKMFLYFITSIGAVMLPRISNVYHKEGGQESAQRYIGVTNKLALLLGVPMMVGMIAVVPYFIPWYLPDQPEIALLIQIASPIVLFIALSNVYGSQYMIPTGKNKMYTKTVLFGAGVNFCINLVLIPSLGAIGASIGSVIAEFCVTASQYLLIRKEIKIGWNFNVCKYFISAGLMYVVVVFIGETIGVNLLSNLVQVGCGFCVYAITLVVIKEEFVTSVLAKLIRR